VAARAHDRLSLSHFQSIVRYHEALLRDRPRNEAFRRALARAIRPGARVLDVGSGSGLWAVVAARLGARRVVAVEREPLLRPLIERLVAENGVADRVEIVSRDFRQVELRREFDVVVSETVGSMAFEEDIVPIMLRARDRFLRRGGTLIPSAIVFRAAPVRLFRDLPDPRPLLPSARSLREVVSQIPRPLYFQEYEVLAPAVELDRVDLDDRAAGRTELGDVSAAWSLARADHVDGIAVWLSLRLGPRAWLETRGSGAWSVKLYPIERFRGRRGLVSFRLRSSSQGERWGAVLEGTRGLEDGYYCPEFAYGSILAAHRRRKGARS
jgi:predicted RNA methylase